MRNKELIWKIVFCIGAVAALAYVFLPIEHGASMWDFIISSETTSAIGFFASFSSDYQLIADYPIIVKLVMYWIPLILLILTAVLIFIKPVKKILNFVLGAAGAVIFLIVDIFMIANDMVYAGIWMNLIGAVIAIIGLILLLTTDSETDTESGYYGEVKCVAGEFAGGVFAADNVLIVGKDSDQCNLILSNKTVSRVHCIITYIPETDTYTVKDVSKNGTFFSDGKRLVKEFDMQVPRGTEIYMGEPKERFILN